MSGAGPRAAPVNWLNKVVPMPVMTASTSTLMPVETTWPSTFSAMKAVLLKKAKGSRTKPASVTSLNSISVMKTCTAMMKKASTTITQASSSTRISARLENTAQRLENWPAASSSGLAASSPFAAIVPGFMNSSLVLAPAPGPEQAGERYVDGDQRGREERDLAAEQAEA